MAAVATRAASSNKGEFDMSKTIHKYVYLAAIFVALGMVFARSSLHAEVILSEIMYDPQNAEHESRVGRALQHGHVVGKHRAAGNSACRRTTIGRTRCRPTRCSIGAGQALVLTPSTATLDSDWG